MLPADFILPHESQYFESPPSNIRVEFSSLNLSEPADGVRSMPLLEKQPSSFSGSSKPPDIQTYPAAVAFTMTHDGIDQQQELSFSLKNDVYFVTAHPCAPSSRVKFFKSPTSPTIQQIDVAGNDFIGKSSSSAHIIGKIAVGFFFQIITSPNSSRPSTAQILYICHHPPCRSPRPAKRYSRGAPYQRLLGQPHG